MNTNYCPGCNGFGIIALRGDDDTPCELCHGTGRNPAPQPTPISIDERQWIRVSYLDLATGDTIQNGTQGDYVILSIGEAYQGVRVGTVRDEGETESRPMRFTNNGNYTLVKGALLDAARQDGSLVDDRGVWVGKGRMAG